MVLTDDRGALDSAWRALSESDVASGWRTIPVFEELPCTIWAGRRFPANQEALIVQFRLSGQGAAVQLPDGAGFSVIRVELPGHSGGISIALCRQPDGNRDLFIGMVVDLIATMRRMNGADESVMLHAFVSRILAWQEFMRRGRPLTLSAQAEVGLFGELQCLEALLDAGIYATTAIDSWRGPLGALHDFEFPLGAIEVKTSAAPLGEFRARVGSLDQLDTTQADPLFVAAVKLVQREGAMNLHEKVSRLEGRLSADSVPLVAFRDRLLHAGYVGNPDIRYDRTFSHDATTFFPVTSSFPRITREGLQNGVRSAQYEIVLDPLNLPSITIEAALGELHMLENGTY